MMAYGWTTSSSSTTTCSTIHLCRSSSTNTGKTSRLLLFANNNNNNNNNNDKVRQVPESTKPRFKRNIQIRKRTSTKPKRRDGYWLELDNVELELRLLWDDVNVTLNNNTNIIETPPPIPNESLLNYWKRYDIRNAIVQNGGRDIL